MSRRARAVMICGTTSGAGKSFLATALARWYARQGLRVSPFKAQNMSNNARVVTGGEMGSAQYFQALAARAVPEVRMNPVLLKPEKDTQSQVVLLGQRDDRLSAMAWRDRSEHLWPIVRDSLEELATANDVLVIEGAGSPAEINLQDCDIVNMRIAEAARAATLLICDIDRGGAFAHLYGTFQLLPEPQQRLIRGFVLNRFRGDASLLAPGPEILEKLTGVPTLGVLPMWRNHGLPEEDGVFDARPTGTGLSIAIVAYPRISNLDEFAPLQRIGSVSVSWVRNPQSIVSADLLILPGSKHVAEDIGWLREVGLDAAIARHVGTGKPTLAICGGLQMLGQDILDPHGVEGAARGLDLLPLRTELQATKRCARTTHTFGTLSGFWSPLSGIAFDAYEIRHGTTGALPFGTGASGFRPVLPGDAGWQQDSILGIYTHGLFESADALRALFGRDVPSLDDTFDGLADFVERHIGARTLESLVT